MSPQISFHIFLPGGSPFDKGSPSIVISKADAARSKPAPGRKAGGAAGPGRLS